MDDIILQIRDMYISGLSTQKIREKLGVGQRFIRRHIDDVIRKGNKPLTFKNKYEIIGDITKIFLVRKGVIRECVVDTDDFLSKIKIIPGTLNLHVDSKKNDIEYAYINKFDPDKGKQIRCMLHRLIMEPPQGMVVDHINHDGLDNRKENLRVVTHQQNMQNQLINKNNKSGFKNVSWCETNQKWVARVKVDGKYCYLGNYNDAESANEVATKFRIKHMPFSQDVLEHKKTSLR